MDRCPALLPEFRAIRDSQPLLSNTGCTAQFCSGGRAIRAHEPRIGENRSIHQVEEEALAFLHELRDEGAFLNDNDFQQRVKLATEEIRAGAVKGVARETGLETTIGGNWTQTVFELEFGLRRSWRNSRRCIMRSHCEELRLYDLRHVTSSAEMGSEVIKGLIQAYDNGNIHPSAFVFPPREPNSRGPMIWNVNILSFAGYEGANGVILGDPANVDLTKAIMDLGWDPPEPRTRFDLLPLVTMAARDSPVVTEIPSPLSNLVEIRHPEYMEVYKQLDLKWCVAPALSRLGFDIGGVQYTAAPFIGWFMDAEIGVRNLVDSFRYNALPGIIELTTGKEMDDLPEYEKLALMSRAQADLNYAVYWSFAKAGVTIIDSLTASTKWTRYDDDFRKKHGFRLPSDPYWIAPPQGSIIPTWHRGGAPFYQPKPMICRHVEDPVKAWHRQANLMNRSGLNRKRSSTTLVSTVEKATISIYYCSSGTTAEQMARKLKKKLERADLPGLLDRRIRALNELKFATAKSMVFIVASNIGHGDVPTNGSEFLKAHHNYIDKGFRYAILGIGDSRYATSFNGSARKINEHMKLLGGLPMALEFADVSKEMPPVRAFDRWWDKLEPQLHHQDTKQTPQTVQPLRPKLVMMDSAINVLQVVNVQDYATGHLTSVIRSENSALVTIEVGKAVYKDMGDIQILPVNSSSKVRRALRALCITDTTELLTQAIQTTWAKYLTEVIDLELPFLRLEWLKGIPKAELEGSSVLQTLERARFPRAPPENLLQEIAKDMPLLLPRTYSIASSLRHSSNTRGYFRRTNELTLMMKLREGGRMSDIYLRDAKIPSQVKYRFIDSVVGARVRRAYTAPLILVATGACFAPIRCLLQMRMASRAGRKPNISLFLGLKVEDVSLVMDILNLAAAMNLFDMLCIVPSNNEKIRVYDKFYDPTIMETLKAKIFTPRGLVYVCSHQAAAKSVVTALDGVIGGSIRDELGERYIEEVF